MGEIPDRIDRGLTPDQAASAEELADKRGISIDMAERAILGAKIEDDRPHRSPRERRQHRTGHVRDYESDRDHELAELRESYVPMTEEEIEQQRAANAHGRMLVEEALDDAFGKDRKIKAIQEQVEREIPIDPDNVAKSLADRERLINARLRTYFEHRTAS